MTLIVLAAGMGTRFGARVKQLEPIGPNGELLIDYSIYDAKKAGFDRVVFIIRKDIEKLFCETIGNRVSKQIKTDYVFQSPGNIPCRAADFPDRTKPWGTAQALYCCKDVVGDNFGIINSDDFYGYGAFEKLGDFLRNNSYACSVGFVLKNTVSENGTVNRGICRENENGILTSIEETREISLKNGVLSGIYMGETVELKENDIVSMSMWGFAPSFFFALENQLKSFINGLISGDNKSELTIAEAVQCEIRESGFAVQNLQTDSKWFGLTYEADIAASKANIISEIERGIYPQRLWDNG